MCLVLISGVLGIDLKALPGLPDIDLKALPCVPGIDPNDSLDCLVDDGFIILGEGVLSAETLMVAGLPRVGVE